MKSELYFLNGKFVKEKEATISINDLGLLRSYGVFDVLRTYNGKPFLLNEHLSRFFTSAKEVNLKIPYAKPAISKHIFQLLKKNGQKESLIKIVITGGVSEDGMTPGNKPTLLIITKNLLPAKKEVFEKGVKLITYEHERFMPSAKTLNYIHLMKSFPRLKKEKAFTLLYTTKGRVSEGATCNIFIFKKGTLITPNSEILNGITREYILKLAKKLFPIQKRKVYLKELLRADEAFITLTTKGIVPVIKVNKQLIGSGKPGPKTKQLMKFFEEEIIRFSKS